MSSLLYDTNWAVTEFADAEWGDLRRTQRLVELAGVLAQHPTAALPEACGDGAMLKAADRFFDNDAVEPQDVLLSHIEATYGRLAQVPLVLAVQDTTEVDWTAHPATKNLGPLGHSACRGLMVHSTLAFTPERVPLGLLAQPVWTRDPDDMGKRSRRKQLPISQKESQEWLMSLEAVFNARAECPLTRLVSVGDREADVYDVLAAERPEGVDLLIRASWDRCVEAPERYVWATVEAQAVAEQLLLQVPRRGAQPAREATLALRFCPLTWCPPRHRKHEGLSQVRLWAVQVVEVDPPADVTPIEWMLLTTVAVDTVKDAIERVEWYGGRWGIELIFKSWKSHCHLAAINAKKQESVLCYLYGRMLLVLVIYALYPQVRSALWVKKHRELSLLKFVHHFQALAESWMQVIFQSELALRRFLQEACEDAERLAAKACRKRRTSAQALRESLNQPTESIDVAVAASA